MGAAASVESQHPIDASDIRSSGSVDVALGEVVRLRNLLGHLAKDAGFSEVVFDGSDLVLGSSEEEDFERCVQEVAHIRSALRLSTQSSKRRGRSYADVASQKPFDYDNGEQNTYSDESDSDDDSD